MKPIWYFVGLILLITGVIIVGCGIYGLFNPPEVKKILSDLHPELWWGGLMIIVGSIYVWRNKNVKI